MANKCNSYHLQPTLRYTYHPLTGQPIAHDVEVGVCWGTKECDQCNCGGDMSRCDFYPEVREKALKERDPKFGEWISVEERLPTHKDGKVLIYTAYGISIGEKTISNRWRGDNAIPKQITHWMPLPPPPTEKEN